MRAYLRAAACAALVVALSGGAVAQAACTVRNDVGIVFELRAPARVVYGPNEPVEVEVWLHTEPVYSAPPTMLELSGFHAHLSWSPWYLRYTGWSESEELPGYVVAVPLPYEAQWQSGLLELNLGCESCHWLEVPPEGVKIGTLHFRATGYRSGVGTVNVSYGQSGVWVRPTSPCPCVVRLPGRAWWYGCSVLVAQTPR